MTDILLYRIRCAMRHVGAVGGIGVIVFEHKGGNQAHVRVLAILLWVGITRWQHTLLVLPELGEVL